MIIHRQRITPKPPLIYGWYLFLNFAVINAVILPSPSTTNKKIPGIKKSVKGPFCNASEAVIPTALPLGLNIAAIPPNNAPIPTKIWIIPKTFNGFKVLTAFYSYPKWLSSFSRSYFFIVIIATEITGQVSFGWTLPGTRLVFCFWHYWIGRDNPRRCPPNHHPVNPRWLSPSAFFR